MTGGQTNLTLQAEKTSSKDSIDIDLSKISLRNAESSVRSLDEHSKYLTEMLKLDDEAKW